MEKGPARHNMVVEYQYSVTEKHKLWKECKQGNTSKENYLEAEKKVKKAV